MARRAKRQPAYQPIFDGVDADKERAENEAKRQARAAAKRTKGHLRNESLNANKESPNSQKPDQATQAVTETSETPPRRRSRPDDTDAAPADPGPPTLILYVADDLGTAGPFTGGAYEWPSALQPLHAAFITGNEVLMYRMDRRLWKKLAMQLIDLWDEVRPLGRRPDAEDAARLVARAEVIVDYVRAMGWTNGELSEVERCVFEIFGG